MKDSIGIDLDGVVCDIYTHAFGVLREMYPNKVKSEIISDQWDKEFGLTSQQVSNCFAEVAKRGMLRNAKIYPGVKEALYKLNRRYSINFLCWRDYVSDARSDTLYWLDSNKIPYERLIITNNKYKIAMRENFCFFIDDNVKQCNRLAKTLVPTYLFARPWNRTEPTDALVKTVSSWKDVEIILNY